MYRLREYCGLEHVSSIGEYLCPEPSETLKLFAREFDDGSIRRDSNRTYFRDVLRIDDHQPTVV